MSQHSAGLHNPPIGSRRAILICDSGRQLNHLRGPQKDADRLSAKLRDSTGGNFEVECLLDKGLLEVRVAVARACSRATEHDTLLFYYSGNTILGEDNCLYLAVSDTTADEPRATSVDAEFILAQMRASRCQHFVLLVDGSHSGAFFRHNRGIPDGMIALTSCRSDELSRETPEGGSFTSALIAALSDPAADSNHDGTVSVEDVFHYIQRNLSVSAPDMHPQKWVWNLQDYIEMARSTCRVFLSYSTQDNSMADTLVDELEKRGITVWRDSSAIHGGSEWEEVIMTGISQSRAVILLLTEHSMRSQWVKKELSFATAEEHLPLIPLEVQIVDPPRWFTLKYGHIHRQPLDIMNSESLDAVAESVRRVVAGSSNDT
jgi:hypothetical protein